jgi:4-alpha-glucanotransferase
MATSGPTSGKKHLNSVTLLFKLPYYTQWGQSLLIAGSEPALGSWNVKQGVSLSPVHQDSELIWCGSVSVVAGFTSEYKYYVVDDKKNVLRWEAGEKRKLVLPEGVKEGDVIEIRDWWQVLIIFITSVCIMFSTVSNAVAAIYGSYFFSSTCCIYREGQA